MSPLVFQTREDHGYDVEIAGVGTLAAQGRGGIPVERAAEALHELQDRRGRPLRGKALDSAAEAFAAARGLATRSYKTVDEEALRVEAGAFPAGKSIEEISREAGERERAQVQTHDESARISAEDAAAPESPGQEA